MRTAAVFLCLCSCLVSPPAARAADPARKNVVLLIADDMGLDLACYGNDKIRMPNLDALAKNGVCFSHGFAVVSSCSPSRASLYTGLFPHTSGQYGLAHAEHNFHTRDNVQSLPRLLKDAGYRTGILGKVHVIPPSVYPFDATITEGLGGNRSVAVMARKARQFFEESGDRPFLLVVGFSDPHRSARGFGNENSYPDVQETRYDPKDVVVPSFLPDQPEVREDLADYYQSCSRLDLGVGLVLDALTATKNADNTLVLFLSDNGIPFPGAKTTLYDPGLHLPLLISSPVQKRRGLTNPAMVSWVDITPTILDWAGVKAPKVLPGRSVLPILEEEKPKGWDVVYGSHEFHEVTMYYPMRMVRTRQHKYLLNLAHQLDYPVAADLYDSKTWQSMLRRDAKMLGERSLESFVHRPREELYDLEKDPNELHNVAGDPKYAEVLADLRKRLKSWQQATKDPWVVKYTHE
jgi:N-sulfoglucosamine sulfohydrolase